ncbi:MAG: ACT domain-containing protein, partial [Candidatus Omnitrophica bacterium]|nr:ACT domain-containing protein [Candidatus Omnitrophota bacterium]
AIVRKFEQNSVGIYVYPALIPKDCLLSKVNGDFNAVSLNGDTTGNLFFYGRGAGMLPTASAVVSDLVEISKSPVTSHQSPVLKTKLKIKKIEDLEKSYYIRFLAIDQPGVLAEIARILGKQKVSIASVVQKERREKEIVPIVMMTHCAKEKNVQKALKEIDKLSVVRERLAARIEE